MRKYVWALIVIVTFLFGFGTYVILHNILSYTTAVFPDYKQEPEAFTRYWEQVVEKNVLKEAYEKFKAAYRDIPNIEKHMIGHAFAKLLYNANGLDAMAVCDADFSYSCFHEIIGSTVYYEGLDILPHIQEICGKRVWCQHGIGHALIDLYGYDFKGLSKSVEVCATLPIYDPIDGCVGGAFMEYFEEAEWQEGGEVRPYDEGSSEHVCAVVQEFARDDCYFWIGQWFLSVSPGVETEERFIFAAAECNKLPTLDDRLTCYKRLGYDTANYSVDPDIARSYCEVAIPFAGQYFEVQCKAAAASMFFAYEETRPYSEELCVGLLEEEQAYCLYAAKTELDTRLENFVPSGT